MSTNLSSSILKETKLKNGQVLVIRKPTLEDAEEMIEYLNAVGAESDNLTYGKDELHLTVEQEEEYIKNVNNDDNALMILGIIHNSVVCIARISSPNNSRIAHNSELGISVKKEYWKNGIGSIVMEELINFAKGHDVIRNISLGVKASNDNAIRMYEKFGFKKVGVHKGFFNVNGILDDEILMDLYL